MNKHKDSNPNLENQNEYGLEPFTFKKLKYRTRIKPIGLKYLKIVEAHFLTVINGSELLTF